MTEVLVVLCTCPDSTVAAKLGGGLVENGFAACVNILPEIRSIYRWRGELHNDGEVLMVAKSTRQAYPDLEAWLQKHHPYDVPEILAVSALEGSASYLEWVKNQCQKIQ